LKLHEFEEKIKLRDGSKPTVNGSVDVPLTVRHFDDDNAADVRLTLALQKRF
jgi:hypothetical protein